MTDATRPSIAVVALALVALVAVACGSAATVPPPAGTAAVPSPASVTPSPVPTVAATTPSPADTALPSTACGFTPQTGILPSDRFTDMRVELTPSADVLTFVFGNPSPGPPSAPPMGSLELAKPPYTHAGSGEAIEVIGEHVLEVRFTGMSLSNDVGQETYVGRPEIEESFPVLRHAAIFDMSEGVVGWYIGYDGSGCVTLSQGGGEVELRFEHR